ncbi:MAG TPA: lipid-A-disaccharide synthase [Burkholderiales bacterium]|nr:lipid-A-disaccharide synthase [Burkholderiales bacterium]
MEPLTIGMVAGEPSGDTLGLHLMLALRRHLPGARFTGIGGPRMIGAGFDAIFPMEKLSVMGIAEVLRHFPELAGIRRRLAAHFLRERPRLFIGIDAPEFNLGLERKLKSAGVPTVHYVSPQIWAWRAGRVHKIRRAVSKMLVLYPFEKALYERAQVPVAYVGHPLADVLGKFPGAAAMREQLRLPAAAKIVALLPGSRVIELKRLADLFVATAERITAAVPDVHFLVPFVSRETRDIFEAALYRREAGALNMGMMFGHAHEAMAAADVVLAASGTVTLEAALLKRPMVITYKAAPLSAFIHRALSYLPYVGLPNVLAGKFIVPEFLQEEATPENLAQAVTNLLFDAAMRQRLEAHFGVLLRELRLDAAGAAAAAILPLLEGAPA